MTTEIKNKTNNKPIGWVLYDGHCGFCSAGIRRVANLLHHLGYATLPLQTPWVAEKIGASAAFAPQELALLTPNGQLLNGIDAYLFIAEKIWWARPLARIARIRPIYNLLHRTYRWIADHRQQISATCRLHPDLPRPSGGGT